MNSYVTDSEKVLIPGKQDTLQSVPERGCASPGDKSPGICLKIEVMITQKR